MENGTRTHPMNPEIFVGRCLFLQNHGFIGGEQALYRASGGRSSTSFVGSPLALRDN